MGQKAHPSALRLGFNLSKTWNIESYSPTKRDYSNIILKNIRLRERIFTLYASAQISRIVSDMSFVRCMFTIFCRRPGLIIGSGGSGIEDLKKTIAHFAAIDYKKIVLNIREVVNPDLDAKLVADSIASQIEKRVAFRKAMKRPIQNSIKHGAIGVKVVCAGRLAGAEIARTEKYMEGKVPLHTLRADIDYANVAAHTSYGVIGIKVWIYRPDKSKNNKVTKK
jgi:small subunit ribosomal protein S3